MLEHIPHWLGNLLRDVRAGHSKLVIARQDIVSGASRIDLSSPAFADGARLPVRFTADGDGVSPPLVWGPVPPGTASLALIVEDPDAPFPSPLVHAVIWGLAADAHRIGEGEMGPNGSSKVGGGDVGKNSFFDEGWLPPDPPTGHGTHDYVFQLFALTEAPPLAGDPGRSNVVEAIKGRVLAAGMLIGTYSRDEPQPISDGSFGSVSAA